MKGITIEDRLKSIELWIVLLVQGMTELSQDMDGILEELGLGEVIEGLCTKCMLPLAEDNITGVCKGCSTGTV